MRTDTDPLVTILLPTFARKAGGYLQRSIESVLAQTEHRFELVVMDDGSTDGSAGLIAEMARRDRRVRHHRLETNIGLPALTLAQAYLSARGDFIVATFDDCVLRPDHLAHLLAALSENPDAVMAYGQCEAHWQEGETLVIGQPFDLAQMKVGNNHIPNAGVMLRRSAVERFGWYDPHVLLKRFCDWDLWLRIGTVCPPVFVPEILCDEYGTGLPDSLGQRVTVFRELMFRYAATDRDERLHPARLSSYDPFRVDILSSLSGEERAEIEFLVLEHFVTTGNDGELLRRFAEADPTGDPPLISIRTRYLTRRLEILSAEHRGLQQSLLTAWGGGDAKLDRCQSVFEAQLDQVRTAAVAAGLAAETRLAAALQERETLAERLAATTGQAEADRSALEHRLSQAEIARDELALALQATEKNLADAGAGLAQAEADRLAIESRLRDVETGRHTLDLALQDAKRKLVDARMRQERSEADVAKARALAKREAAHVNQIMAELTRVTHALSSSHALVAEITRERENESERYTAERHFWHERQRSWSRNRDELVGEARSATRARLHAEAEWQVADAGRRDAASQASRSADSLEKLTLHAEALRAYCETLEQSVRHLTRSRSWRATAPFRALGRALGYEPTLAPTAARPLPDAGPGEFVGSAPSSDAIVDPDAAQMEAPRAADLEEAFLEERRHGIRHVIAIGDGPITPVELCLDIPLAYMEKSFGLEWKMFFQDDLPDIAACREADLVIMMRTYSHQAVLLAEALRDQGIPLLYTTDDDIEMLGTDSPLGRHYAQMGAAENIHRIVQAANVVVVYSESLLESFSRAHPRTFLANAVSGIEIYDALPDPERLPGERHEIRIGYAGSPKIDAEIASHALLTLLDSNANVVVESIWQTFPALEGHDRYRQFDVVGGLPAFSALQNSRDWDIAIAPLKDTMFNNGKTDNKYRSYGAAGVAGVYTNIRPFERSIAHGITGLLVDNNDRAWIDALTILVDDGELRRRIGEAARRDVRRRYSLASIAHEYHGLYDAAAEGIRVLVVSYLHLPTVHIDAKLPFRELRRRGIVHARFRGVLEPNDADLAWADVLLVIRAIHPEMRDLIRRAKEFGIKTVFSWDDDFFSIPDEYPELQRFHNEPQMLGSMKSVLSEVDLVKASTKRIAAQSRKYNSEVVIAPYGFDMRLVAVETRRRDDGRIRIGYFGSIVRGAEMVPVCAALGRIAAEYDHVDLIFFGLRPPSLEQVERFEAIPFVDDYEASIRGLAEAGLDIGLAPLAMDDLARAKLPTKYRDYGATHAAGIYTDVEPYSEIITPGVNGLLAENNAESWYQAMRQLVEDTELRRRIAATAFEDVRTNLNLDVALNAWSGIFRRLGFAVPRDEPPLPAAVPAMADRG